MKIYYAKIPVFSAEEMQQCMEILPKERAERIGKIKLEKSSIQSVAAGLLLEHALSEHGMQGKNLTFLKNTDGKPFIAEYPEFHYNLSHSKEYVVLVVDECPVGIDIEELRMGYQKLATRFFSLEEVAVLKEHWSDDLFTKLWTRKESYLKATGFGMRMPIDGFSILEEQVRVNEKMPQSMIEAGVIYYLSSMPVGTDSWLSVCRKGKTVLLEQDDTPLQEVDLKEILKKV
ncbi:MAG: 4'-phosphopantetheinyl transferase superfamily protein [Roseburia sp.]|nr:4'-phosphopantetheinyl transferase superfamily protein [Roseburia sp.]